MNTPEQAAANIQEALAATGHVKGQSRKNVRIQVKDEHNRPAGFKHGRQEALVGVDPMDVVALTQAIKFANSHTTITQDLHNGSSVFVGAPKAPEEVFVIADDMYHLLEVYEKSLDQAPRQAVARTS
jgi:hypothetical protein